MDLQTRLRNFLSGKRSTQPQQPQPSFGQRLANFRLVEGAPTVGQAFSNSLNNNLLTRLSSGSYFGIPQVDRVTNPIAQPIGSYGTNQVVNPIRQGTQALFDPNASALKRGVGALQVAGGVLSATPVGMAWNAGVGAVTGTARTVRTGQPLTSSIASAVTTPTSLATEGLGITNPYVALASDVLLTRKPQNIVKDPLALKGATTLLRDGKRLVSNLKAVSDSSALLSIPSAKRVADLVRKNVDSGLSVDDVHEIRTLARAELKVSPAQLQKMSVDEMLDNLGALLDTNQYHAYLDLPGANSLVANNSRTPRSVTPPRQVGLGDLFLNRTRNVIEKQGVSGKKLGGLLHESREVSERTAGDWVHRLPTVRKLTKQEFDNFVDVAEGVAKPMNRNVKQASTEWATIREEVFTSANEAGLDVGRVENYFPRRYDQKMFTDRNRYNEAVNHLVKSGQVKNEEEAIQILARARDITRNRRFGNLELAREFDLPGYDRTPEALLSYLEGSARRIGQARSFGAKDEKALKLINSIRREGGDAETAKDMFDTAVGAKNYGERTQQVTGALRRFNTVTKLGLGAVTNMGQSVNTATTTGVSRTIKAMVKSITDPKAREDALKIGVTLDGVINDLREGVGLSGKVLSKITAPGFGKVERFNRTVAVHAGKGYLENAARNAVNGNKSAIRALERSGLDPKQIVKQGGKLTEEQLIRGLRRIVERTQFKVDPQDLPGWASSPWGRVLTQFRTFSYNQSAFIKREIIDEAVRGNVQPLVRFLAVGIPAGAVIKETRNLLQNRESEQDPNKRVVGYFDQSGGLGLARDLYRGFFPDNKGYLSPERRASIAAGTLFGPTVGTGIDTFTATSRALNGNPDDLGRLGLRHIPVAGPTLQNTLLPYGSGRSNVSKAYASEAGGDLTAQVMADGVISPTEEVAIEAKLSELKKQEEAVLNDNGTRLPFLGQLGGKTDAQKDDEITKLRREHKKLENLTKGDRATIDAEYSLTTDRLKRAGDSQTWLAITDAYIAYLIDEQGKLDPELDRAEYLRIQNKIEDLIVQADKYRGYGGFSKGRGGNKVSLSELPTYKAPSLRRLELKKPTRARANKVTFKAIDSPRLKALDF